MVFTFGSRELCDPKSGWRFVSYTAFVSKVVVLLLVKVYESFQLFVLVCGDGPKHPYFRLGSGVGVGGKRRRSLVVVVCC